MSIKYFKIKNTLEKFPMFTLIKQLLPHRVKILVRKTLRWFGKYYGRYHKIIIIIRNKHYLKKMQKRKTITFQISYGGLGDHLVYSALPRLLFEQHGIKSYISTKSIFINSAIYNYVWGKNPYVSLSDSKGWTDEGEIKEDCINLNEKLEKQFKVKGEGLPEIYYKPRIIAEFKDRYIVDATYGVSGKYNGYCEEDFIEKYIYFLKKEVKDFIVLNPINSYPDRSLYDTVIKVFSPPIFNITDLYQLTDAIYSSKMSYLLYTGSASISAAIRKPSKVICRRKANPYFVYSINEYIHI